MIERRSIRFEAKALEGLELPCIEARGAADGPHLCLLAGVHGGEYSSIAAAVRFMNKLDTSALSGRITAVPIVSMTSFRARAAFVVPEDGKNLNRCFPGSADGTFSEVLAHHVFDQLIAPADVLIDLHGGDMVEALEPFTLYNQSEASQEAQALAVSFGFPYVVRVASRGRADRRHDRGRGGRCRHSGGHRRSWRLRAPGGERGAPPHGWAARSTCAPRHARGQTPARAPRSAAARRSLSSGFGRERRAGGSLSWSPGTWSRRGAHLGAVEEPLRRRGRGGRGTRGRRRPLSHLEPGGRFRRAPAGYRAPESSESAEGMQSCAKRGTLPASFQT